MTDIIRQRNQDRVTKINKIRMTLLKAQEKDKEIDDKKLIMMVCGEYGVAKRTAQELVEIAKSNLVLK